MPQIKELHGRKDLRDFQPRMDIQTSQIPFKNAKLEEKRQQKMADRKNGQKYKFANEMENEEGEEVNKPTKKRRKVTEWEQLQREEQLIKKFKRGKLSKQELEEKMDEF